MRDELTAAYRGNEFCVTMVATLRDGTSQAVTVLVDTNRLYSDELSVRAAYAKESNDRVVAAVERLAVLFRASRPGDG